MTWHMKVTHIVDRCRKITISTPNQGALTYIGTQIAFTVNDVTSRFVTIKRPLEKKLEAGVYLKNKGKESKSLQREVVT